MSIRLSRRAALVPTAALLLALLAPTPAFAKKPAPATDPMPLAEAKAVLKDAAARLRDSKAITEDVSFALKALASAHAGVGSDTRAHRDFRRKAEALLLKGLTIVRTDRRRRDVNRFDPVNVQAAELLGGTAGVLDAKAARSLSRKLRTAITKDLADKRKPEMWSDEVLESAFAALAELNDHDTLLWMAETYRHSKAREVPFLIAAHKALVRFEKVPGKLRHTVCRIMIQSYAGVESAAERSSNSAADRAMKRTWDRLRTATVPVLQHFAGRPKNDDGQALSTVGEFQAWWKDHKGLRDAAWKDQPSD